MVRRVDGEEEGRGDMLKSLQLLVLRHVLFLFFSSSSSSFFSPSLSSSPSSSSLSLPLPD